MQVLRKNAGRRIRRAPAGRAASDEACVIRKDGREYCVYPLDDVVTVLGRKWALLVIGVIGNQPWTRFNEIQTALPTISPRTLTDRLQELEALKLVARKAYAEVPLRVEYALTPDGVALRDVLIPMLEWAEARDTGTGTPS